MDVVPATMPLFCVPHHVGPAKDDILIAEVMVHAKIEIVSVIDGVAGVQAVVDRKGEVGSDLAVLKLRRGVGGNHVGQFAVDEAGRNLVAGRPSGHLNSVTRLAKGQARIRQRVRIPRCIAHEPHRRVRPRFGERVEDRVRRDRRLGGIHRTDQGVGEVAREFRGGRNVDVAAVRLRISPTLVGDIEKRLILDDRPAECAAEFVLRVA